MVENDVPLHVGVRQQLGKAATIIFTTLGQLWPPSELLDSTTNLCRGCSWYERVRLLIQIVQIS
jgi:hypothetical protein